MRSGDRVFFGHGGAMPGFLAKERHVSVFEPEAPDRFRVAEGRERGELLRVVRDDAARPVKLYWATSPVTREPETFG